MRTIDSIIIHCSATPCGKDFTAADIDRWHRQRSFNGIGYHFVIRLDGTIENGRPIGKPGAHCLGWNNRSIGICYIGGLDNCGRPADTRTNAQREAMKTLICQLQHNYFGIRTILGHRDTSPDLNGDGRIEPNEFIKSCPCFDVRSWLRSISLTGICLGMCMLSSSCGSHKSSAVSVMKSDASVTSQAAQATLLNNSAAVSQQHTSDSFGLRQNLCEEFMQKTTIIHRKRLNASIADQKHNERNTDTLMTNMQKSVQSADTARTSMLDESVTEKRKRTGAATLWLIGGGCAGTILLVRQSRRIRKK